MLFKLLINNMYNPTKRTDILRYVQENKTETETNKKSDLAITEKHDKLNWIAIRITIYMTN